MVPGTLGESARGAGAGGTASTPAVGPMPEPWFHSGGASRPRPPRSERPQRPRPHGLLLGRRPAHLGRCGPRGEADPPAAPVRSSGPRDRLGSGKEGVPLPGRGAQRSSALRPPDAAAATMPGPWLLLATALALTLTLTGVPGGRAQPEADQQEAAMAAEHPALGDLLRQAGRLLLLQEDLQRLHGDQGSRASGERRA